MAIQIRSQVVKDRNSVEWSGVSIAAENALAGNASGWSITGAGDPYNVGYAYPFNPNVGDTVAFRCNGIGTQIDVYRIGYYAGAGWRLVTTLTNTATNQPNPTTISSTNGGTHCGNWSTTASWSVPSGAVSGLYIGVYRNGEINFCDTFKSLSK